MRAIHSCFLLIFVLGGVCLNLSGAPAQNEIKSFLWNVYNYMSGTSLVLENIYTSSHYSPEEIAWGNDCKYIVHNGMVRYEMVRNNGHRVARLVFAAPPTVGQWYWQEERLALSGEKPIGGKVIWAPVTFHGWMQLLYGMVLPPRLDSGQYKLREINYGGRPCYQLTVIYPSLSNALKKIPLSHVYEDQNCTVLEEIFNERFPGADEAFFLSPDDWMFTEVELTKDIEQIKQFYIKSIRLIIDKDPKRPVVYGYTLYGGNGKILSARRWTKVQFPEAMNESLFVLPGQTVITAGNQDFGGAVLESYGSGPSAFRVWITDAVAATGRWFRHLGGALWDWLLQNGVYVTLPLGVLCIAGVIFLKRKYR